MLLKFTVSHQNEQMFSPVKVSIATLIKMKPSFESDTLTFFPDLLSASVPSSRQEDRYNSFNCVCSNKEETGRARPLLISLAQILVVNGKC